MNRSATNELIARLVRNFAAAVILTLVCVLSAVGQQELRPAKAEAKVTFGGAVFGDDELFHGVIGGSARYYLSQRFSIEPEFLYMRYSENDQDFLLQPNLAVDLRKSNKKVVPYLIGGVGLLHHRAKSFGFDFNTGAPVTFDRSSTGWTASGGVGVKIFLTDRLFVAPEARLGREPTARGTVSVGYVFSGRK